MTPSGFSRSFEIAGREVGDGAPCYVIAEAGVAHFGSLEKARRLIDLAVASGADCVKFQHFRADRLIGETSPEWRDRLKSRELSDADMLSVRDDAKAKGIPFLCTGHEEAALDFLDRQAKVPAFKVGSGEVENWPFLAGIGRRGKPVILSTGMYTIDQIAAALGVLRESGCRDVAVLHCVTAYPVAPKDVNLRVMHQIREIFDGPVGYSDHTAGTAVPLAAVALGAEVIEKHITLDVDVPNAQDWKVSCTPETLPRFISDLREVEAALGDGQRRVSEIERQSILWARKSLTAAIAIEKGETLRADMLVGQRPGDGIPPSRIGELIGRRAHVAIPAGTKLSLEMIEP
jgi:N-acetylneuraminate synthase/N,N'-diacetyllegionaminate synthase